MASDKLLRAAICGSGMRSRSVWQRHLAEDPRFELVGVHDPSREALEKAVEGGHVSAGQTYEDLPRMLSETRPDVLIAAPIIAAHAWAVELGLEAGCHVLVEKPFTSELSDAVRLAALARERRLKLGVVQNWRTRSAGESLHRAVAEGAIGEVSHVFFRYLRDREKPHLPDYLFEEPDPLLYAMAIHHIDLFRYVLGQEIVRVSGEAGRPRWSRYRHPSINQLWMETEAGVAISYVATFSSRNAHIPQESLQVEGELGTLYNDSQFLEPPLMLSRRGEDAPVDLLAAVAERSSDEQYELADRAILTNFRKAVTASAALIAPAEDNLGTLAVLDAARAALRDGSSVDVERPADLLASLA